MDPTDDRLRLDEDKREAWTAFASVLLTLPAALDAQLRSAAGMTFYEYLVLSGLTYARGGALRLCDLAVITNGSQSRLSQVVAKLERRGWLVRRPDPGDGRATMAVLTEAGREHVDRASPGHLEVVRKLVFDPLTTSQVRQMREINRRVRTAIDPDGDVLFQTHKA
ncbi:MarR family winged helix-turn-helix transcriptional regulator [Umezawaea endophytica]|uniref:MarR family transcriptional regulator n=1 Tax=Umezawaea endophytica TaxID=1654476 RepID=A0A9X2VV64_9PSEU|nr:MarR family transcriptional regulator [Umezawaea endophytica]MCS7482952.1 MarR family transcriptional regulator [Umezawaea endophytica]